MEENQSAKNIRIAKNTFFLYLRMFLMMGISLYTSRIVLSTLGEVDYGLYNVVGGIVTMFTFVNFAMTCATNRYLSFELGKNNIENVNKVFSTSIIIHVVIAIFIFLLGETIGLWFLNTQMTIPADRMVAANWIYQLSILSCMVMIVSVPYNAIIISKVEVVLRNLENKQIEGTSNSERIVYGGLRKGLYQIESPLLNKTITIRLK